MLCGNIAYIVDPDRLVGEALSVLIETYGINAQVFSDAEELFSAKPPINSGGNCLMVEANLPGLSGLSLLRRLRKLGFFLPVLVLTNAPKVGMRRQALAFGATDLIDKSLIDIFLSERLNELFPDRQDAIV